MVRKKTTNFDDMPMLPFADSYGEDETFDAVSAAVGDVRKSDIAKPAKAYAKEQREQPNTPKRKIQERSARRRLKVTFPDGTVINEKNATLTMIATIERLGIERVAELKMECCHVPLVSKEVVPKYKDWTKPMKDGWYLLSQSDTDQKHLQLLSIKNQLGEEFKVETVEGYLGKLDGEGGTKGKSQHKSKRTLIVKLDNGTVLRGINHADIFVEVIKYIGIDKVASSNVKISQKPIITSTRQFNNQVELSHARWLTIPNMVKDKYRAIVILASVARLRFEVSIE